MTFLQALNSELNTTTTENGAKAYISTESACLDLFGKISSCRDDIKTAEKLFLTAYKENPEAAVRILFYSRDIRGGQSERAIFRSLFAKLARTNPALTSNLIELVPYYGRWDDLLSLEGTPVWMVVLNYIKRQLDEDLKTEKPSLMAKWLPSINASSKDSKRLGRIIASHLGLSEREYRKTLTQLREKLRIVETLMCSKEWSSIQYDKLPSRASFMYRNAFKKHDEARYSDYLSRVEKGEAKINASTLFPYDIVHKYLYGGCSGDKTLELQWNALTNYMEGQQFNGLVVADVSGSMSGMPMSVSISLAMYIAERNCSPVWKDKFLTFSAHPTLQTIVGNNIEDKIQYLLRAEWQMNTDLNAVFRTILGAATAKKVPQDQMPQKLIIVSDMQFDECCRSNKRTNFEQIQKMYRKAGYELPELIFWNVNSTSNVPVKAHDSGTCLVSGCSPSILKYVLTGAIINPLESMNDVIFSERYEPVGRAFV
jgi:hypothetical protein